LNSKIITILLILTLIFGGVFAIEESISIDYNSTTPTNNSDLNITLNSLTPNTASICLTTADTNTNCNYNLDENDFPYIYNLNSDGTYKINAFAKDGNNYFEDITNPTITVDTSIPTVIYSIPDGNAYKTAQNITVDFNDLTAMTSKVYLDGILKVENTTNNTITSTDINEGTHTITVDANDSVGHRLQQTITFSYDTNAPNSISVSSNFSSNYTNDVKPDITLSASDATSGMTGGKAYLSCSTSGTWLEFNYATTYSDFNIIDSTYDCNSAEGNKTIYAKFKDKAGNESATTQTTIKLDRTIPSPPTGLSVSAGNTEITLSWTAPSADNLSGNYGYKIYKNGELHSTITSPTTTSKTITGLSNGTSYTFKIKTLDNAGNESEFSSTIDGVPVEDSCNCDVIVKRNGSNIDYAKDNDNLDITCNIEEESDNVIIKYRYETNSIQSLTGEEDNTDTINDTFNVDGDYTRVSFWCEWRLNNTDYSSSTKTIYIDNESPEITWGGFDNNFAGTKEIYVDVTDNKNVNLVEFEINNIKHGTSKNGNKYYTNLNTTTIANGNYTLKAIAYDKAGNQKTISKTITISNILTADQTATKAINDAKATKLEVDDLIKYFNDKGIAFNQDLVLEKEQADALLLEAESTTNTVTKTTKANQANTKYLDILNKANIGDTKQEAKYEFSVENLTDKLYALGLTQEQVEKASALILSSNVERKLSIIKVGNQYNAQIEITLTIDGNEETYKIIEVIPKEFIKSATMIYSNINFLVIEDDPIIEFSVPRGTSKIYYSISVDENTANDLIDSNVISNFASPPIIILGNETLNITENNWFGTIIGIILTIILVLIIAGIIGIIYIGYNKDKTTGFNHEKPVNPVDLIKEKLQLNKQKSGKEKWKYKNK
jgi:hypothetical protein